MNKCNHPPHFTLPGSEEITVEATDIATTAEATATDMAVTDVVVAEGKAKIASLIVTVVKESSTHYFFYRKCYQPRDFIAASNHLLVAERRC